MAVGLADRALAELAFPPGVVGGYEPQGSEIDCRVLMERLAARGHALTVPVVVGDALDFSAVPTSLLVPLLGFDRKGHRLGQGGGYYDRYLATRRPALVVGLAFALQEVAALPVDPWDCRLDVIVTEDSVIRIEAE
jgi:5-formyltetrahydrofolate cyclo-ligase